MTLKGQSQGHSDFEWQQFCMVYIYLPAAYCHLILDFTKENMLAVGFSAVPAVFLVLSIRIMQQAMVLFGVWIPAKHAINGAK